MKTNTLRLVITIIFTSQFLFAQADERQEIQYSLLDPSEKKVLPSFDDYLNTEYQFDGRRISTHKLNGQFEDSFQITFSNFDSVINGPFWETWQSLSIVIMILGVIVYLFKEIRATQIHQKAQLAEFEQSALRAQMNPHFIFNSLNAIQGYIAQGDKQSANRFLSRFSKLIRSALQHSRVTKVSLEDDLANLKSYIELEQMRFKGGFDFQINIAEEIDVSEITIPPMLIQPFVENAIVHGLANKEGNGKIDIDFQSKNGALLVTVIDNGIGIETSKKQKAGIASSHKSVGMTITKRRLEMLSSDGENGNLQIQELKDEFGKVVGTKVSLQIPFKD